MTEYSGISFEKSGPVRRYVTADSLDAAMAENPNLSEVVIATPTEHRLEPGSNEKRAPGRPAEMQDGRPRRIYIDDAHWTRALELGEGNASSGVRIALDNTN